MVLDEKKGEHCIRQVKKYDETTKLNKYITIAEIDMNLPCQRFCRFMWHFNEHMEDWSDKNLNCQ